MLDLPVMQDIGHEQITACTFVYGLDFHTKQPPGSHIAQNNTAKLMTTHQHQDGSLSSSGAESGQRSEKQKHRNAAAIPAVMAMDCCKGFFCAVSPRIIVCRDKAMNRPYISSTYIDDANMDTIELFFYFS